MTGEIAEVKEYTFPSGAKYKGTFHDTLRHGHGYWCHPCGEEYEGYYVDNMKCGLGHYRFQDSGKEYIGHWGDDKQNGVGIYYFNAKKTAVYFGSYTNDKKDGKGQYLYENGTITEQHWSNGTLLSEEKLAPHLLVKRSRDLRQLVDEVQQANSHMGVVHPPSTDVRAFQFPSGATYTGQYFGTKKHGTGQWLHPEGDKYEGQFYLNKHCGWGVYVIGRSGKKYVGEWSEGKMSGVGVYFFTPEETEYFVGMYRNDVKHGVGMYHFSGNQKNKIQHWEEGTLVDERLATPEEAQAYTDVIQEIINTVRPYAPEYEPMIFQVDDQAEFGDAQSGGDEEDDA